jgi:hypothetical protein
VVRYPHIITIDYAAPPVLNPTTGQYTPATKGAYSCICRAESNSKGTLIVNAEGNQVKYSYAVYLPVLTVKLPFGAPVVITDEALVVFFKGTIQGFEQLQKSTKVWV